MGDSNVVNAAGKSHLTLARFVARPQICEDLDRLSSYTRSTPLVGGGAELASLHSFLQEPRAVMVRVLTGAGGSGKTRLPLELTEQAVEFGWSAGFVTRQELRRFFAHQNLSDCADTKAILEWRRSESGIAAYFELLEQG